MLAIYYYNYFYNKTIFKNKLNKTKHPQNHSEPSNPFF